MLSNYFDRQDCHLPILLALCLLLFFLFLGARDFWDIETHYAEVIRVMTVEGNYPLPTMNGALWLESPPLYFWLATLLSRTASRVNEWTIRLPSALSATELVLICYYFLRQRFDARVAFLSTLVLATAILTVHVERHVPINMTFYLFMVIALFLAAEIVVFDANRRSCAYGAWFCCALACLTNGLLGIIFPVFVTTAYVVSARRWRQALALCPLTGGALFFTILICWAVSIYMRAPESWLEIIYAQSGLAHHSDHAHADGQFFFRFPLAFSPWAFLLAPAAIALWPARAHLREGLGLFLFIWFVAALIIAEILHGYHGHYVFLTLLPLAVGVGTYLDRAVGGPADARLQRWTHRFISLFCALLVGASLAALPFIISAWPLVTLPAIAIALTTILGATLVYFTSRQRSYLALIWALVAFPIVINALLQGLLFPALNQLNGRAFAEKVGDFVARHPGAHVAIARDSRVNFYNYYAQIKRFEMLRPDEFGRFLAASASHFALVRERSVGSIEQASRANLKVVLSGTTTRGTWLLLSACASPCAAPLKQGMK